MPALSVGYTHSILLLYSINEVIDVSPNYFSDANFMSYDVQFI